jgi:hypothetical protein
MLGGALICRGGNDVTSDDRATLQPPARVYALTPPYPGAVAAPRGAPIRRAGTVQPEWRLPPGVACRASRDGLRPEPSARSACDEPEKLQPPAPQCFPRRDSPPRRGDRPALRGPLSGLGRRHGSCARDVPLPLSWRWNGSRSLRLFHSRLGCHERSSFEFNPRKISPCLTASIRCRVLPARTNISTKPFACCSTRISPDTG